MKSNALQTATIVIQGMVDEASVRSILSALNFIRGVGKVKVSLMERVAEIEFDPRKVHVAQLHTAIRAVGFGSPAASV